MPKARGIYKRGRIWWIRYAGPDGKMVYESSGSTRFKDAEALLHKRKAEVREGRLPEIKRIGNHTFKELSEEYKKWAMRQKSFRTKIYYIESLEAEFGNLPLRRFNTMLVEQYQTKLINQGLKPATCNRYLATLKHMFTKAVDWNMVEDYVLKSIRRVKFLPEDNKRLRYLSIAECQALVNACEPHLKPIVITALNTGMRKGEILSLRWDQVDLRNGFILLEKTKNGERREIPINETLRQTLQALFRSRRLDIPYVFYDPKTGKPYQDVKRSFNTALKRATIEKCPECGYERAKPQTEVPSVCPTCGNKLQIFKGIKDFRFHDLRHTFASHLVMSGVDLTTVKELLGHKDIKMTLRYAHLAPSHKQKAVQALSNVWSEPNYTKTIQFPVARPENGI